MLLRIVIRAQIRKHDIVIRAKNTLFLRITIMHVKTLDISRRMFQCMFYDSHEKMYFHCDVFSIKTGYTIIRCLNSNVKYVVWSNIEGHLSNTSFSTCTRASNQLGSIFTVHYYKYLKSKHLVNLCFACYLLMKKCLKIRNLM